jgi:hypothetical protein
MYALSVIFVGNKLNIAISFSGSLVCFKMRNIAVDL